MQTHFTTVQFYPDKNVDVYQTCYLESPAMGAQWQPTRAIDGMLGGWELTITLRSIVGPFDIQYFAVVIES